jgi:hypothetical protein
VNLNIKYGTNIVERISDKGKHDIIKPIIFSPIFLSLANDGNKGAINE